MSLTRNHLYHLLGLLSVSQIVFAAVPSEEPIEEVLVLKRRESDYSVITERAQKIVEVPGVLGDPLMAAFSLPGVIAKDEGGAPAVRGSSPSDNRYMIDGAPAGYVFHAFSTSIINENIIQDFQLYSAGFGAAYSNATGGVFDITLRDPKHQSLKTKVDLSILRAGLFVEGEATENSAFYLSARGSLLQYFLDDKAKEEVEKEDGVRVESAPQDSDYQFKYVYDVDGSNKLTLSANGARDLAAAEFTNLSVEVLEDPDFAGDAKIKQQYDNASLNWRSQGDNGSLLTVTLGQYVNHNDTHWANEKYLFDMKNSDTYLISRYDFLLADDHNISVGSELHRNGYDYNARFINYVCTDTDPDCVYRRGDLVSTSDNINVNEAMIFVNDHWVMSDKLSLDLGGQAHHNSFTKETFYNPRFAAAWNMIDNWTLTTSIGAYNKFPEIDKLFPDIGNPALKSPTSNHYTVGVKHNLREGWSWNATAYYKTMDDLPLAMGVKQNPNYTNNVEGEAYGVDVFINKELTNRWYGWLALSTSKSVRTNKLTGEEKNYYLDTPVVLNIVANYKLTPKWTMGGRFTTQTGRAYTPILGAQKNPYFDNHILPIYGDAYSDNLPVYARLDLRFKYDTTFWGYQGSWNIDILNATNRRNVTDRNLDYKKTRSLQDYKLVDSVGLGIIPAMGISVTF